MKPWLGRTAVAVLVSASQWGVGATRADNGSVEAVKPMPAKWAVFEAITGFHSVVHREVGLAVRVLEADGSASVAMDPVSLFVVGTNGGTTDLEAHVWLLPRTVAAVRDVVRSGCGVDIMADVDRMNDDGSIAQAVVPVILKVRVINHKGALETDLRLSVEGAPKVKMEKKK